MASREIDRYRVKDYDGLVHHTSPYGGNQYWCGTTWDGQHGVWRTDATTCLFCLTQKRGERP